MRLSGLPSLLLCLLPLVATAQQSSPDPQARQHAEAAARALQQWYVPQTGLYTTTGWWNAANAITALTDLMRTGGSQRDRKVLANTFTHAQIVVPRAQQTGKLDKMTGAPGFLNTYYDDEGWWALAWIDVYDLTQEARYLSMAESIFSDMAGGWDDTCHGGIWWSKDRTYKNAIANELFLSVAAHLAARTTATQQAGYLDWANKEWRWFQTSGMINNDHLVNDGLDIHKATGACTNNGRTVWTYNQGVVLGALAEWSHTNTDPTLLTTAQTLATAGLDHLTDAAGVLHDPCEPARCGGDAPQFKGIFVRNLRILSRAAPNPRYTTFFQTSAEAIWSHDRTGKGKLGLVWSGPALPADASTQSSALEALIAALPAQR